MNINENSTYNEIRKAAKELKLSAAGTKLEILNRIIEAGKKPFHDDKGHPTFSPFVFDAKKHHRAAFDLVEILWENREAFKAKNCLISVAVHPKTGAAWGVRGKSLKFSAMVEVLGDVESARHVENLFKVTGNSPASSWMIAASGSNARFGAMEGSPAAKRAERKIKKALK